MAKGKTKKQSSAAVSKIAARLLGMNDAEMLLEVSKPSQTELTPDFFRDVRKLAASVLSQDETKG